MNKKNYKGTAGQVDPVIFKAYDIRGVVDKMLTLDVVYDIGRAVGSEVRAKGLSKIAVGRDGRLSGPGFIAALSEGLAATGCEVTDIGQAPTPVLYFANSHLELGSGIAVTGSHNPPDYNGFKIVIDGNTLAGEEIQRLRQRIEQQDFIEGEGQVTQQDVSQAYLERITGDIKVSRPLKVVVDAGNGVAGELAPRLLKALGCEVIEMYCEIDGHFPNHHPDPSKPENLVDMIDKVRESGADLGMAFDGDGDRLGLVDGNGKVIWPDRQLMLYAADVLSRNPGAQIIYDVKCTRFLSKVITDNGGEPLMWKTGHSLIKRKMRETGALLAGEMSGHVFFKERWYGFDDALYTAARLLEILSADSRPCYEVFAELPEAPSTPELNVHFEQEGANFDFMQRLTKQVSFPDATLVTIDGIRADFSDGWGLVRASNTTPSLVIRFEADNDAALQRIQGLFRDVMLQVEPELVLPF